MLIWALDANAMTRSLVLTVLILSASSSNLHTQTTYCRLILVSSPTQICLASSLSQLYVHYYRSRRGGGLLKTTTSSGLWISVRSRKPRQPGSRPYLRGTAILLGRSGGCISGPPPNVAINVPSNCREGAWSTAESGLSVQGSR